jgi:hypothetical protein
VAQVVEVVPGDPRSTCCPHERLADDVRIGRTTSAVVEDQVLVPPSSTEPQPTLALFTPPGCSRSSCTSTVMMTRMQKFLVGQRRALRLSDGGWFHPMYTDDEQSDEAIEKAAKPPPRRRFGERWIIA